ARGVDHLVAAALVELGADPDDLAVVAVHVRDIAIVRGDDFAMLDQETHEMLLTVRFQSCTACRPGPAPGGAGPCLRSRPESITRGPCEAPPVASRSARRRLLRKTRARNRPRRPRTSNLGARAPGE